jgi:diguanylate cyclase (GGDEF)-like protein
LERETTIAISRVRYAGNDVSARPIGITIFLVTVSGVLDVIARLPAASRSSTIIPSLLAGVLVPLMLPRVSARLRRALVGERRDGLGAQPDTGETCVCATSREPLRRENAMLRRTVMKLETECAALRRDAAQHAATAQALRHLAHHDALTKLPNRLLLLSRLAQALATAGRAGSGVLVVYLDLDNFKTINDKLGHAAGDRALCEFGARIASCLRTGDTASRVGGDEFVLVCATTDVGRDAAALRARLLRAIGAPFTIDGTPITLSASLGMSAYPDEGSDAAALIDRADEAMYRAKRQDRAASPRSADAPLTKRRTVETRRYEGDDCSRTR